MKNTEISKLQAYRMPIIMMIVLGLVRELIGFGDYCAKLLIV